ncbi:DUF2550 family protein [Rarobacter faecitabidus]|uniref:DUF2550 family protein n=1 Tax=Rarobacter faecitabidus TaxID=13243 RepID=UPI0014774213|nr:DUF2550 family protein [Rarobacter faecitabidus]
MAFVVALATVLRFRWLARRPGSLIASWRPAREGAKWRLGILRTQSQRVDWYGARYLIPFASRRWPRGDLEILSRRKQRSSGGEELVIVVLVCAGRKFELLMSQRAYAGLASWYESAPPQATAVVY